jgi:hypothetical protein
MDQALQVAGALLVLAAFLALQSRRLTPQSLVYVGLNLAGSAILAVVALIGGDWGFLLLQGVWALVSAWSLVQLLRGRPPEAAHQH